MKIKRGQSEIRIRDLCLIEQVTLRDHGDYGEVAWAILRIQPQTVLRDEACRGEGQPRYYVHSRGSDTIMLFPVPDRGYELEVVYFESARRC